MCGRCKDCKYFKRFDNKKRYEEYRWEKYGTCQSKKFLYGLTHKEFVDVLDDIIPEISLLDTDLLLYNDYDSYNAEFEVGENFGCIHFEENISRKSAEFHDIDLKKLKEFQNEDAERMKENV